MQSGRALVANDTRRSDVPRHRELAAEAILAVASVPILREGRCLGVLNLDSDRPNVYGAEHLSFLEAPAPHLATALARFAHSVKGNCANLGAAQTHAPCVDLERLARGSRAHEAEPLIARLEHEFERVCAALDVERRKRAA